MAMRLLPKKDVDAAKVADRKREIDEGKKLASSVDSLRELRAKEETGLEKWRVATIASVQVEVNAAIREKASIEDQIRSKREELFSLSGPLDKAWKFYIESERAEIDRQKYIMAQELAKLERNLTQTQEKQVSLEEWSRKLASEGVRLAESSEVSKKIRESAELELKKAQKQAQSLITNAQNIEEQAKKTASQLRTREEEITMKENNLKIKEDELETREMAALAKELLYYSPVKKN